MTEKERENKDDRSSEKRDKEGEWNEIAESGEERARERERRHRRKEKRDKEREKEMK